VRSGTLINAPDEAAHMRYIQTIAEDHKLPTRNPADPLAYEWHQPPLYYMLASALYYAGTNAIRGLSVLFGLLTVLTVYATARKLFPDDPVLPILAMSITAMLPMRQSICGTVTNDTLLELFFALAMMQIVEAFHGGFTIQRAFSLGICVASALLTKSTGLLLMPVICVAFFLLWRNGETTKSVIRSAAVTMCVVAFVTAPLFAHNLATYHELTPVKAFMREFADTSTAAKWIGTPRSVDKWSGELVTGPPMTRAGYYELIINWTSRSFVAAYTPMRLAPMGIPVFMPAPYYALYLLFGCVSLFGLLLAHRRRKQRFTEMQVSIVGLLILTIVLVSASFAGFTWTFFQTQGRYLYPALLPISVLGALGFRTAIPVKYRDLSAGALIGLLFVLSLALLSAILTTYGA